MNWIEEDIQLSIGQSEYIDTAIIPISEISWGVQAIKHANTRGYIDKFSYLLEKKYKGRILRFPMLFYCEDINSIEKQIQLLKQQLINENIKHIYLLTIEREIKMENVIFIPDLPIEKLDNENQMIILNSQVDEVMKHIDKNWNK